MHIFSYSSYIPDTTTICTNIHIHTDSYTVYIHLYTYAYCHILYIFLTPPPTATYPVSKYGVVCCSVLQCVAVCCNVPDTTTNRPIPCSPAAAAAAPAALPPAAPLCICIYMYICVLYV